MWRPQAVEGEFRIPGGFSVSYTKGVGIMSLVVNSIKELFFDPQQTFRNCQNGPKTLEWYTQTRLTLTKSRRRDYQLASLIYLSWE